MPATVAFPLQVPGTAADRPFSISRKFGPDASRNFSTRVEVFIPNPATSLVRAPCAGTLRFYPATNSARLVPEEQSTIMANDYENASAFVFEGLQPLASFIQAKQAAWTNDVAPGIPPEDRSTPSQVVQAMTDGTWEIQINRDQIGITIGTPDNSFAFKVETSRRRILGSDDRNVSDPAAHWKAAMTADLLPSDVAFVRSLLETEFANQVILEIRDDRNAPAEVAGSGASIVVNLELTRENHKASSVHVHSLAVGPTENALANIQGFTGPGGQLAIAPDNEFLFWDSVNRTPALHEVNISLPTPPAHVVVHCIRPSDWFAPQTAFYAGFPGVEQSLSRYTRSNTVSVLVDGVSYFADFASEVTSLSQSAADYWHVAGWSMDPYTKLASDRTIGGLIANYSDRLVLHLFANPLPPWSGPTARAHQFANADRSTWDGKLVSRTSAAHLKVAVIRNSNGLVAYCGGIDFYPDRVTDETHSINEEDADQHDVQLKVRGPAAAELDSVLYQRWVQERGAGPIFPAPSQAEVGSGTHLVQVARTVPQLDDSPLTFAVTGDTTIRDTLLRALQRATQFIYIEDQYFTSKSIVDILHARLRAGLRFVVVVLPEVNWETNAVSFTPWASGDGTPRELLQPLLAEFPERVAVCHLRSPTGKRVYVHAKLQIVDDVFFSCGSANLDYRGLATRQDRPVSEECNLMCLDESVTPQGSRSLARDMRIQLWTAHLGLHGSHPILIDPLEAFDRCWKREPGKMPFGMVQHFPAS